MKNAFVTEVVTKVEPHQLDLDRGEGKYRNGLPYKMVRVPEHTRMLKAASSSFTVKVSTPQ